jgi:uncharacterized protein (TIGR02145 family)
MKTKFQKTLVAFAFLLVANFVMAQVPQGIPYQAVARDNAGNLIKNQNIALRFSIHDGTANGAVVYSETHSVTTDALGLFSVKIGGGTSSGTFANINWGSGAKFTQVALDVTGGSNFIDMGTTQMMSVPYALYAGSSGNSSSVSTGAIGQNSSSNGAIITNGVLSLTPADATNGGIVTNGTQTFAGSKTFSGNVTTAGTMGVGTTTPVASAKLEVTSTTQGFLPPRMTAAQRDAIQSTATGLVVFCIDCGGSGGELQVYAGGVWRNMVGGLAIASWAPGTVNINGQIWQSTNLDVATFRNGDPIPQVDNPSDWNALTTPAWCYYNNDPANNAVYGKLYNIWAVKDARGLAPDGWHIPNQGELTILQNYLDGANNAGGKLKEQGFGHWVAPNTVNNSPSFFNGLPGGSRKNGVFNDLGLKGNFWSSNVDDHKCPFYHWISNPDPAQAPEWGIAFYTSCGYKVYYWQLFNDNSNFDFQVVATTGDLSKLIKDGYSVRCIKD